MAPVTIQWNKKTVDKHRRRAYPTDENADGIRTWAEQLLVAVRHGNDPELLHEIWVEGNEAERAEAKKLIAT
jgi:hypothetical protein